MVDREKLFDWYSGRCEKEAASRRAKIFQWPQPPKTKAPAPSTAPSLGPPRGPSDGPATNAKKTAVSERHARQDPKTATRN